MRDGRSPRGLPAPPAGGHEVSPAESRARARVRHLNQPELAARLGVSPRTLEGWRYRGKGPAYLRLEGRVAYRIVDVERFEAECRRTGRPLGRASQT